VNVLQQPKVLLCMQKASSNSFRTKQDNISLACYRYEAFRHCEHDVFNNGLLTCDTCCGMLMVVYLIRDET
jgi:hypothetical protein